MNSKFMDFEVSQSPESANCPRRQGTYLIKFHMKSRRAWYCPAHKLSLRVSQTSSREDQHRISSFIPPHKGLDGLLEEEGLIEGGCLLNFCKSKFCVCDGIHLTESSGERAIPVAITMQNDSHGSMIMALLT